MSTQIAKAIKTTVTMVSVCFVLLIGAAPVLAAADTVITSPTQNLRRLCERR